MAIDPKRVKEIFLEAAEIPDDAARAAYLDRACGGDAGLRGRVEVLLRSHDPDGSFLGTPAAVVPDPAHAGTMAFPATPEPDHDTTRTSGGTSGPAEDGEALHFLTPSARPDSRGRIGHYEVLEVLGKGGFGIVFRAFDDMLQRVVAVKVMAPQLAATSPARKRFLREARSSAQVRHENVVQVYEVVEHPLPFLAMEFIPGETLQQRLDRTGPLEVMEVVRIGRQIAEGLAAAHATDLIHRDIKPSNILIEGGQQKAKLTDFGLARAADDASISQSGIIAGTPMFMAPEQALGAKLDQRADLFSFGSVLYQMTSGRPPFRANSTVAVLKRVAEDKPRDIREIIPETPEWLCNIIAKLHEKKPDDRYQTAREIADVLADCEHQLKVHGALKDFSRIPGGAPRRPRQMKRKWAAAAAAAAVVLLPMIALAVTELAGVTHLFRGKQATTDPIKPGGEVKPPIEVARQTPDADGWVQLFNGRDTTGWKTHPDDPNTWTVEDGAIAGGNGQSYLFTERADFENFHLRAEAQINPTGDAGVVFRTDFNVQPTKGKGVGYTNGYEAQIAVRANWPVHTGSLSWPLGQTAAEGVLKQGPQNPHRPNEWFLLEVIARGPHIQVFVDGKQTVDYRDDTGRFRRGHIALQRWGANITQVRFRKIEIKELPASSSADGWVQLFNGKDLAGWKGLPDLWRIEGDDVIGSTANPTGTDFNTFLVSPKSYQNFELRFQVRLKGEQGNTGFQFRSKVVDEERFVVHGPQIDVGRGYWSSLYLEGPPWRIRASALADVVARTIRPLGFNEFHVRCVGKHLTVKFNGDTTIDGDFPEIPDDGVLALQIHRGSPIEVTFRKIEIKELPASSPEVPRKAADVLPFLAGTWKVKREELGPKVAPDKAVTVGYWTYDYVAGGKLLRAHGNTERGNAHAVRLYAYDAGQDRLRLWQARSSGYAGGPITAAFNPDSRTLTWMYLSPGGNPQNHQFNFAGPDNFTTQLYGLDEKKNLVRTANLTFTRVNEPVTLPTLPTDPTRPAEMKVLDRLVGEWTNEITVTDIATPDKPKTEKARAKAESILGGRCIEMTETNETTGASDYTLAWFDPAAKQYREWFFHGRGYFLEFAGAWDEAAKTLTWHSPDKRLEGHWVFKGDDRREFRHLTKATDGKILNEAAGVSRRVSPAPPPAIALFTDDDVKRIAALPAAEQIKEVSKELMKRNPGFDGQVGHKIEDGVVTEFRIVTDRVTDIAPIRAWSALRVLECRGTTTNNRPNGQLENLTPLEGMNLAGLKHLDLSNTKVGDAGLANLKGMPLKVLRLYNTGITDLTPLQGMPLEDIRLTPKNITRGLDLLRAMKGLKTIGIDYNQAWPAAEFWERYDKGEFKE